MRGVQNVSHGSYGLNYIEKGKVIRGTVIADSHFIFASAKNTTEPKSLAPVEIK